MEVANKIENLLGHVKEYAETKVEIVKLYAQDKSSEVISSLASAIIITLLGTISLLFFSLGAAWEIGRIFGNASIGFFSVAGFYLIISIVLCVFRKQLIKGPIADFLIRKFNADEKD